MRNIQYLLLSVLMLSSFSVSAFAYYHPDEGRWINRDPIVEKGSLVLREGRGDERVSREDLIKGLLDFFSQVNGGNPSKLGHSEVPNSELIAQYASVFNDQINNTDSLGLDRYRGYDQYHEWIAVDEWECEDGEWKKTGAVSTYHFGPAYWWGTIIGPGLVTRSPSTSVPTGTISASTACQDWVLKALLDSAVISPPTYSVFTYNCWDFVSEHWPAGSNRTTPDDCCGDCGPLTTEDIESKDEIIVPIVM